MKNFIDPLEDIVPWTAAVDDGYCGVYVSDPTGQFIVKVDTSDIGVGFLLAVH